MYRKIFTGIMLSAMLVPAFALARTEAEVRAELATVDQQISTAQQKRQALLDELDAIIGGTPSQDMECTTLTKNIPGVTVPRADILKLQAFLISQGLLVTTGKTGVYDAATITAVQRFQSQQGIAFSGTPTTTGYGAVGPSTRGKIREVSCRLNTNSTLQVVSPNGGETFIPGTSVMIRWSNTENDRVTIQLVKGREVERTIVAGYASSTSQYIWKVPRNIDPANNYGLRIVKTNRAGIADDSDGHFAVKGNITVISPNGGETVAPGSTYKIQWNAVGLPRVDLRDNGDDDERNRNEDSDNNNENTGAPTVGIRLIRDGTVVDSIATVRAARGAYNWRVPGSLATGSDYKIRIVDATFNGLIRDESDAVFTVGSVASTQQVSNVTIVPTGSDTTLNRGNTARVSWTSQNIQNLRVSLYSYGVFVRDVDTNIAATNTSLNWILPNNLDLSTTTANYRVRVSSTANTSVFAESAPFMVLSPALTVTAPNGGTYAPGSVLAVKWTADGRVGNLNIQLLKGGLSTTTISTDQTNDGQFNWRIPGGQALGSDYKIRVVRGTVSDETDAAFSIGHTTNPITASVTATGDSLKINWTVVSGVASNVKIDLVKEDGTFVRTVRGSVSAERGLTGLTYTVPAGVANGTYKVRVSSLTNTGVFADTTSFVISGHTAVSADPAAQTAAAAEALNDLIAQLQQALNALR